MSKSLKNSVTIKEALQRYTSRQLRLAFLLHPRSATLEYSDQNMVKALHAEKMYNVSDILWNCTSDPCSSGKMSGYQDLEAKKGFIDFVIIFSGYIYYIY